MVSTKQLKKKILVVEDEAVLGRLCQRVLGVDYEVDVVGNGLTAREMAAAQDYDFCVSDIRLPGLTGMQLYEHWEKNGHHLAEKVIFITGDTLNNTVQDFLKRAGRPYIMKPFDLKELRAAVRQALSREGLDEE